MKMIIDTDHTPPVADPATELFYRALRTAGTAFEGLWAWNADERTREAVRFAVAYTNRVAAADVTDAPVPTLPDAVASWARTYTLDDPPQQTRTWALMRVRAAEAAGL